ncbi:MAG: hypothetical protein QM608_15720 [Caulobacter sp.]
MASLALGLSGCGLAASGGLFEPNSVVGGPCVRIEDFVGGTEDIVADPDGRSYYISATDWRRLAAGDRRAKGGVYRAWFVGEALKTELVSDPNLEDFHPHGLDLWTGVDETGKRVKRLFVVDHPQLGPPSRVVVFDVEPGAGTLTPAPGGVEGLHQANDVAAVGPATYYVTNDFRATHALGQLYESIFAPRVSNVVLVRNGAVVGPAAPAAFGNGVVAADRTVYVAESTRGVIRAYRREADDSLTLLDSYKAGPSPDNLILADGKLWYGGHNNGLKFLAHRKSGKNGSPSRIEVLDPAGGSSDRSAHRIVFRSPGGPAGGEAANATSVGVPVGDGRVLIGSIYEPRVQVCRTGDVRP